MGNLRKLHAEVKGLPLGTQRSDNWTVADMYENYTGKKSAVPGQVNGGEMTQLRKALQKADLERRISEARAILEAQKN
jgi:hypothetical protein